MPSFLTQFETYGGLGVHWIQFGSSGRRVRPLEGGVLGNYYM